MGLLSKIKRNSRVMSDELAGTRYYFELATTNLSLYRALRSAAERHVRGRLLDAGAGRMAYRNMLQEFCDRYESLDNADPAGGIDYVADLQDTGLPDARYDTVFCTQVLQHLTEPGRAVAEMARVLKPGGKVVISVPHFVWLHNEPHDYWRFTGHGMKYLLEKSGLKVLSVEKVGGLVCFLAYAVSTMMLALFRHPRFVFRAVFFLNRFFIRFALWLDRLMGVKSLFPTNFVIIAERT